MSGITDSEAGAEAPVWAELAPAGAPAPNACVRLERPRKGLAVLVLDPPHRKLAILDLPLLRDLSSALDVLATDDGLEGLVITGREPTAFAAGADLDALARIETGPRGEAIAYQLARLGQGVFAKIAALRARTVAAVGGPVPGGAFELCLACDRIVLADHPSTRIGLPETQLGILPGWGGSQRLPRRIGVPAALETILTGRLHDPRRALKLGLVDRLTFPEFLVRIASEIALGERACPTLERGAWLWIVDKNPLARALIRRRAERDVLERTRGHYPAPLAVIPLVCAAPSTPLELGLEREARALARLAPSPECKSLVTLFRLSEEAKKLGRGSLGDAIERAGVIGAGVMGAGIASLCAEKGLSVRLCDVERAPLDRALFAHRASIAKSLARKRLRPHEADAALDRLSVSVGNSGLGRAQIVIEAVAEQLSIKRAVFADLARQVEPSAILATNTSSLSVRDIAEELSHPERCAGMHFFNPVEKMPLVEIVRGERTSEEVLLATARLAVRLGKTPVIVKDCAGFLVNRLLGPYLDEATRLFEAGVAPEQVDEAAKRFGLPMGPLELLDEVGFDIAVHAARSLEAAYGERMKSSTLLPRLLEAGFKGKKSGAGFYVYAPGAAKRSGGSARPVNTAIAHFVQRGTAQRIDFSEQVILDYLLLSMLNEAARSLEEEVVAGPSELDLATVFGMGFPPFRGGLLRWADTLGARNVLAALQRVSGAPDMLARADGSARFQPAELLREMARREAKFHAAK
jgi:3-hydroxyacyl-CoA dehydrogenase / enoyl-CoA hydratase / 3-hydroxybutyryl-CoA epimerase